MKTNIKFLTIILCCLFSLRAAAETYSVSKADALTILSMALKGTVRPGSSIVISPVASPEAILTRELSSDDETVNIDISSLRQGVYVLAYVYNGTIIDSEKFIRQ